MIIIMMFTALLMALDKVLEPGTYLIPNDIPLSFSLNPRILESKILGGRRIKLGCMANFLTCYLRGTYNFIPGIWDT